MFSLEKQIKNNYTEILLEIKIKALQLNFFFSQTLALCIQFPNYDFEHVSTKTMCVYLMFT
jgi:hypothetical protein